MLGVFDRSHYEDVVTVRVRRLVDRRTWTRRYGVDQPLRGRARRRRHARRQVLPAHLRRRAAARLLARLDDPTKHWKYNPGDLDDRVLWDEYMTAYGDAIERCNTDVAPWYVVPADRKWYRNWAITSLLIER